MSNDGFNSGQEPTEESPNRPSTHGPIGNDLDDAVITNSPPQCSTDNSNDCCNAARMNFSRMLHSITELAKQTTLLDRMKKENDHMSQQLVYLNEYVGEIIKKRDDLAEECAQAKATCTIATRREKELDDSLTAAEANLEKLKIQADEATKYKSKYFFASQVLKDLQLKRQNYAVNTNKLSAVCDTLRVEAQNKDRMIEKLKEDKNAAMDRLKAYRKYVPMLLKTVDELVTQNVGTLAPQTRKRIDLFAQPSVRSQLLGSRAQENDAVDQEEQHSDDDMVDDLEDLIRGGVKAPQAPTKQKTTSRRESTPLVHFDERLGDDDASTDLVPVKPETITPRGRGNRRTSPAKRRGEYSRKGRNIHHADELDTGRMAQLQQKLSRANEEASTSASATTRSTIHGRKGMTVREQQAQQAKMTVKERVALLRKNEAGASVLPQLSKSEKKVHEDLRLSPSPVKQQVPDAGRNVPKSVDLRSELRLSPSPVKRQKNDGYEPGSFYSYEDMDSVLPETHDRQAAFADLNIDVMGSEVNPLAPTNNDQIRATDISKAPTIRPSPSLPHLEAEWPSAFTNRVLEIIEKVCVVEIEPRLSPPRMGKRSHATNADAEIPSVLAAQSSFVVSSEQERVAQLEETISATIVEEENPIVHDTGTSASSTVSVGLKVVEKIKPGAEDEMDFEDGEQILQNYLNSRKIIRPAPVDSPSEQYRAERIEQAFIESQEQTNKKTTPLSDGKKKVEVKKSPAGKKRPPQRESTSESEPKDVLAGVKEKEHAETSQPLLQQEHIKSSDSSGKAISEPVEAAASIAPPAPVPPRKSNAKAKTNEKNPPTSSISTEAEKQDEHKTEVPQKANTETDKLSAETPAVTPRRTSRRLSTRTSMSPAPDVPRRLTRSSSVCRNEKPPIAGKEEGSTSSKDKIPSRRSASTMVTRARKASESSNDGTEVFKAPSRRAARMKPSAPKAKVSHHDSDASNGNDTCTSETTSATAESSVVSIVKETTPVATENEHDELSTAQKRIAHKTLKGKKEPTISSVNEKVTPSPRRTTRIPAISPKQKRSRTPESNETAEDIYKPLKKTPVQRNLEPSDFNTVLITGDDFDNDDSKDIPQLENDEQAATEGGGDLQISNEDEIFDADSSNYCDPYADLQIVEDEEEPLNVHVADEDDSDGMKIAIEDKQSNNVPDQNLKKAKDETIEEEEIPTTSSITVREKPVKETAKESKTTRQSKKPSALNRLRSQLSVGAPPSAQMAKMASMLSKRTGSSVSQKTVRKAVPPKAAAADSKDSASTSAAAGKIRTASPAAVSALSKISTIPAPGSSLLTVSTRRISKAGQTKVPVIPVPQPVKRRRKRDNDTELDTSASQAKKTRLDESAHSLKKNAVDVVLKKHSAESLLEKALDMECDYDGIRAKITDEEINLIQTLPAEVFAKVLTNVAIRRQTGDMWMSVWTNYLKQNVESVSNKAEEALVEAAFKISPSGMNIFAPFVRNLLEFLMFNTLDANTCYKIVRLISFSIKKEFLEQNSFNDAGKSTDPDAIIQSMLSFIANENPSCLGVSLVYLLLKLDFNPFLRFLTTPHGHTLFQIAALFSMKDVCDVIMWIWSAKFEYLSDHRLILHTDMSTLLKDLAFSVDDIHVKDGKYEMPSKMLELKMWSTIVLSNEGSNALQNHTAATEKAIDEVLKHYGLVERPVIEGLGNLFTDIMKPSVKIELPLDMLKNLAFHLLLLKAVFPGLLTAKHVFNIKRVFSRIAVCCENVHILYSHLTEKLPVPSEKQQLLMTTIADFLAHCRFLSMYSL